MTYEEWMKAVPEAITDDVLWRSELYRVALFLSDLAWYDAIKIREQSWYQLADQLHRASGSVSANVAEGYGRPTPKDRTRFYGIALGSAREARDWYFKSRHILGEEVVDHRFTLLTQIIRQLITYMKRDGRKIREASPSYPTNDHPTKQISDPQ